MYMLRDNGELVAVESNPKQPMLPFGMSAVDEDKDPGKGRVS